MKVTLTIGRESPASGGKGLEWYAHGEVPIGIRNGIRLRWRPGMTPTGQTWDVGSSGGFPRLPHSGDVSDAIPRCYRASALREVQLRLCDAVREDRPDGTIRLTWTVPTPPDETA